MEVLTTALIFTALHAITELVGVAIFPFKGMKLRVLGNNGLMVCVHILIGYAMMKIHWGTLSGTMAAMLSFLLSFPTLWIAKQCLFGYIRTESPVVTAKNYLVFADYVSEDDKDEFEVNRKHRCTTTEPVPVYHSRVLKYTRKELGISYVKRKADAD